MHYYGIIYRYTHICVLCVFCTQLREAEAVLRAAGYDLSALHGVKDDGGGKKSKRKSKKSSKKSEKRHKSEKGSKHKKKHKKSSRRDSDSSSSSSSSSSESDGE